MAILDPRIIPLIATLTASGADWLAFEVMDGIARGRPAEESEEALEQARARASHPNGRFRDATASTEVQPILGDEQLRWAASYVLNRFGETLDALESSFTFLDRIETTDDGDVPNPPGKPISLKLDDRERSYEASRGDILTARDGVTALRIALMHWLIENTGPEVLQ